MSLSDEDRARLQELMAENKAMANEIGRPFSDGHPLNERLKELIDELRAKGRREFRAAEIAGRTDYDARAVGSALRVLHEEGEVERVGGQTPYRWVIDS